MATVVDVPRVRVEVLREVRPARDGIGGVRTGRAGRIEETPVALAIDDRGIAQERDRRSIASWIDALGTGPDVTFLVGGRLAIQPRAANPLTSAPGAAGVDAGHRVLERSGSAGTSGSRLLLADAGAGVLELDLPFLDLQDGREAIHGGPVREPPRDPVVQRRVEPGVIVLHPTAAAKGHRHAPGSRTRDELQRARDERVAVDGPGGPTDRERRVRLVRGHDGRRVDLDDLHDGPRGGRQDPSGSELGPALIGQRVGVRPDAHRVGAACEGLVLLQEFEVGRPVGEERGRAVRRQRDPREASWPGGAVARLGDVVGTRGVGKRGRVRTIRYGDRAHTGTAAAGTTDELQEEEVKPALQPCLGNLQPLHPGLAVEPQARLQPRHVEERGPEHGHDEDEHEPRDEDAAPLVHEQPHDPSRERLATQCRLITMVTPNVAGALVPSLSVKETLAPGTVAHDWFGTEHTPDSSHVPSAASQGVMTEADHAVADSGTSEPDKRFATGSQGSVGVGRVQRTTSGGALVSRYMHVADPSGFAMTRTRSFVESGRQLGIGGGAAGSSIFGEPSAWRSRRPSSSAIAVPCRWRAT